MHNCFYVTFSKLSMSSIIEVIDYFYCFIKVFSFIMLLIVMVDFHF